MHLAGTSCVRQRGAYFSTPELSSSSHNERSSSAWPTGSPPQRHTHASTPVATYMHAPSRDVAFGGRAHVATHRSRDTLTAELQRIRAEANTIVVERWFWRWGLYAVRRAALRRIQHRARLVLWSRVGARCFAWWRLVAQRRLCREVLYREAAARERATLIEGLCRVAWDKWRQWARVRARQCARAAHLGLVNRQRHALLRFRAWTCHPRRCHQLRSVEQIRFSAERSLARFTLIRWRLHALESYLAFPLQVRAAQQVATAAFRAWQRRALIGASMRLIRHEALLHVAERCFDRWRRWLRRRLQAALLREANEARLVLRIFSQWAWHHELHALDYEQYVAERHLPRLFS
ncbi:hypothetical protein, conserved [Leishmania donovani]|uniref:Uncharacterized protein n=1 Tax=Leishmania donovani TaxID=5661 RepID=A0A3Q8IFU3_LEIDO|nr:hypothetical protein, conserved [Leishmania donovani]AYU82719.1 hypothetical protein LdCL_340044600 [Leishmania donovani]TPP40259.1 hypothetical protein CGC21_27065 [Leishmania donovani]CBZ37829.1 hypothetical protein, conserved [Leishmania donovani]